MAHCLAGSHVPGYPTLVLWVCTRAVLCQHRSGRVPRGEGGSGKRSLSGRVGSSPVVCRLSVGGSQNHCRQSPGGAVGSCTWRGFPLLHPTTPPVRDMRGTRLHKQPSWCALGILALLWKSQRHICPLVLAKRRNTCIASEGLLQHSTGRSACAASCTASTKLGGWYANSAYEYTPVIALSMIMLHDG